MAAKREAAAKVDGLTLTNLGAYLVALAGVGLIGYAIMFVVRNFTGFIELGLTPALIGGSPEEIRAFSPALYEYISHLQVAVSGFIAGLGLAVVALAWFGIRSGLRWALWTSLLAPVVAPAIALPLHYPYGLATFGHLGIIYADALLLLVGVAIAYWGGRQRQVRRQGLRRVA